MTRLQAARYVAAFNRAAQERGVRIWAVAVPVVVRYDGDPQPGQTLRIGEKGTGPICRHGS